MRSKILYFILVVNILCSICTTSYAGEWAASTVGTHADYSAFHQSMAIDGNGKLHVAYYHLRSNELKYATNASGSWQTIPIEENGRKASIAVDSSNNIHIIYFSKAAESGLKYATNSSGLWNIYTADSGVDVDFTYTSSTEIAIDTAGNVHACYYHAASIPLKYASNISGSWKSEIVDINGTSGDIAVDSANNIYVVYSNKIGKLMSKKGSSGNWDSIELNLSGAAATIAIDKHENLHIAYIYNHDLYYAIESSGTWQSQIIDTQSIEPAIALDSFNNVHICYSGTNSTKYATNSGGVWLLKTIDPYDGLPDYFSKTYYRLGQFGTNNSISIDSSGSAHITYPAWLDMTQNILRYATNKAPIFDLSGEWKFSTTENWAVCDPGENSNQTLTIEQTGNSVKATNKDMAENPVIFTGKVAGSIYELVAEFAEDKGNTLIIVSLMASSNSLGEGPQFWLYRESPSYCYGGSSIEYQRSSSGSGDGGSGGGGGGGCFISTMKE